MQPLSRGKSPEEFTLRVTCAASTQLSLGGIQDGGSFVLGTRKVLTSVDGNGSLVLVVNGLATKDEGRRTFEDLRRVLAHAGVNDRLAVAIPEQLNEAGSGNLGFFPDDPRVLAHGWPTGQLPAPLVVHNFGAWLYAEHEYVILVSAHSITPVFQRTLSSITEALGSVAQSQTGDPALPLEVALAATYFAHAICSTMTVWRLMLMVTCLEMLATRSTVNAATVNLIEKWQSELDGSGSSTEHDVDVEHLRNSLRNAKMESISSAVRNLVVSYCAPEVATNPLPSVFQSEADCRAKISALYALRSKYSHEGRVRSTGGLKKFSMTELESIAIASVRHILNEIMAVSK